VVGAVCGLLIGAVLGAYVAAGGGDIQELNDLAGLFVGAICSIAGAAIGLGVGLARRESGRRPPETPDNGAEPPYWPPPPNWSSRIEHEADADAQRPRPSALRWLIAALVIGIALAGAAYLGSLRLGSRPLFGQVGCGLGNLPRCPKPRVIRAARADWQIPVSILIGALGVAGGLVVLRIRPKQPLRNPSQAA